MFVIGEIGNKNVKNWKEIEDLKFSISKQLLFTWEITHF